MSSTTTAVTPVISTSASIMSSSSTPMAPSSSSSSTGHGDNNNNNDNNRSRTTPLSMQTTAKRSPLPIRKPQLSAVASSSSTAAQFPSHSDPSAPRYSPSRSRRDSPSISPTPILFDRKMSTIDITVAERNDRSSSPIRPRLFSQTTPVHSPSHTTIPPSPLQARTHSGNTSWIIPSDPQDPDKDKASLYDYIRRLESQLRTYQQAYPELVPSNIDAESAPLYDPATLSPLFLAYETELHQWRERYANLIDQTQEEEQRIQLEMQTLIEEVRQLEDERKELREKVGEETEGALANLLQLEKELAQTSVDLIESRKKEMMEREKRLEMEAHYNDMSLRTKMLEEKLALEEDNHSKTLDQLNKQWTEERDGLYTRSMEERNRLSSEIGALQLTAAELQSEKDRARRECSEWINVSENLRSDYSIQFESYHGRLAKEREVYEAVSSELSRSEMALSNLRAEMCHLVVTLENERLSSESQIKGQHDQLIMEQKRRVQVELENENLQRYFNQQLAQCNSERELFAKEAKSRQEAIETKTATWQTEKNDLLTKIQNLTNDIAEILSSKSTLSDQTTEKVQHTLDLYNKETSEHGVIKEKLETQMISIQNENQSLRERLAIALNERQRAMKWSERRDKAADALANECQSLRQRLQSQSVKCAKLERDLGAVERERKSFFLEKETMRIDKERLKRWDYQRHICIV